MYQESGENVILQKKMILRFISGGASVGKCKFFLQCLQKASYITQNL